MAGTFTHWMVVEEALKQIAPKGKVPPIWEDEPNVHLKEFVKLGAVSPDLPYLTDVMSGAVLKKHNWADRMHYECTANFIHKGINNLLGIQGVDRDICFAWLCGYVAHVITDVVVHPAVNATVGAYIFNSTEHRQCEMTQDVLIFDKLGNGDLIATQYNEFLPKCSNRPSDNIPSNNANHIKKAVGDFWKDTLIAAHDDPDTKKFHGEIKPDEWFEKYRDKVRFVGKPTFVTRHLLEGENLTYSRLADIPDDRRKKYFSEMRLPRNETGDFYQDVFKKAVVCVVDVWGKIYDDVDANNPGNCMDPPNGYIKNWNLDLGIDMDKTYYW